MGEAMNKEVPMLRYQVDDLSCGHCVSAVTAAVRKLDPAAQVKVDLATKLVEVQSATGPERIAAAIREAGYTPVAPSAASSAAPRRGCCGGR
jgi:copper chaperone